MKFWRASILVKVLIKEVTSDNSFRLQILHKCKTGQECPEIYV